ncbi:MAG: hypothetical protein ABI386_13455 [Rhodanobacter sp.]
MKFESLVLRCLFLACVSVCALIFGAMVTAAPSPGTQLAASTRIAGILLASPATCALPPDGVVCPHVAG